MTPANRAPKFVVMDRNHIVSDVTETEDEARACAIRADTHWPDATPSTIHPEIHPLDMGESTQAAVLAIVNRSRDPLSASGIATALGISETRASQMLSRHAREGRIFRVRHGVYRSKP